MASPACQGKSWADVVVGSTCTNQPIVPKQRGSFSAKCRGELLVMLGHYGWIRSFETIDHPDVSKHGGRIYVSRKDFRSRSDPQSGDEVAFCLYADDNGLGAEDCYVVGESQTSECTQSQFQWVNHEVKNDGGMSKASYQMNPHAQDFCPRWQVCANTLVFNRSYTGDEDSSDSDCDDFEPTKKWCVDDGSTWAGDSSDSDAEASLKPFELCASGALPPGLHPPPGLDPPSIQLQLPIEPPPGLEISPHEMLQNQWFVQ